MEARLYAEDPAKGFLPSIGRLDRFELGRGCRVDTGVLQGAEISPFYDPMIAKVIASGADRETARAKLAKALNDTAIWPLKTNAGFLEKALEHPNFVAARLDTGLIGREGDALMPDKLPGAEALADAARTLTRGGPLAGFRLNAPVRKEASFLLDGQTLPITFDPRDVSLAELADDILVAEKGQVWRLDRWRVGGSAGADAADGSIRSPMPGRTIAVSVVGGESVTKGQKLLALEAMKMEHTLIAPFDGTITELNAREGGHVMEGALLVKIEGAEAD